MKDRIEKMTVKQANALTVTRCKREKILWKETPTILCTYFFDNDDLSGLRLYVETCLETGKENLILCKGSQLLGTECIDYDQQTASFLKNKFHNEVDFVRGISIIEETMINKTIRIFEIDNMHLTENGTKRLAYYIELVFRNSLDMHKCEITGLMIADQFLKTVRDEMADIFKEVS